VTIAWSIRRALPTDVELILAIEQACTEAPHWSKAVWTGVLTEDAGSEPEHVSFVAESGIGITGFAVVSCARGVAELESIAVEEEARRRGVGRALCSEAMAWSRRKMAQMIELEVRTSSIGALALYGSLGFIEQGRRRNYYRDPIEDAVLMSALLWS
jgi:[ribosomal protein S18]-alanine N-acetyltransferase